MIVVGFVLLIAAVVVAIALIVQNPGMVTVHAFSWSRDVEMRWLVVAGLALTAIGLLGLAMMRVGGARYARLRRERKALAVENRRLVRQARTADVPAIAEPRYTGPASTASTTPRSASAAARGASTSTATEQRASVGHSAPGPAAPSTGAVAAPGRPSGISTEPRGIRERLAAKMHRRSKG
jgi:uncharacterized integral membrane protein